MVSTGPRRRSARLRQLLVAVVAVLLALTGPAAPALADPGDSGGGGTYGFNDACEQLGDLLPGIGIGGFDLGTAAEGACKLGNAATHPGDAVTAVKDKAWDLSFGKTVSSLLDGLGQIMAMSLTWWTKFPNTTMANSPDLFSRIRDYTFELQIYVLVASLIAAGIRMAIAKHGAAEAEETFKMLGRTVFASVLFSSVLVTATKASDEFATWVINESTDGNARGMAEAMISTSSLQAFSPGLVLILAILGILGGLAQIVFLVIRQGLLVIVVGMLPLAAAGSGFDIGRGFYQRLIAWTIAFLLWKPVAALVYMIAFTTAAKAGEQTKTGEMPDADTAQRLLVGMVLLCSTGILLPAIMRLASPIAVSASSRSGGGMGMVAGAMVMRRVPMGAKASRGGAGTVTRAGGSTARGTTATSSATAKPPTGTNTSSGGGTGAPGPRGPAGPAGPAGRPGRAGAPGAAGGNAGRTAAARAAGPAGALALGAATIAASGVRAGQANVSAAASPGGAPSTPGTTRPTGSRSKVQR